MSVSETKDCILFSTADWDDPYWTNKQHTAVTLAALGWRVLYVESVGFRAPRMGSGKDWRRLMRRLRRGLSSLLFGAVQSEKNIWVLSPLLIPSAHHVPFLGWINKHLLRLGIFRHVKHHVFSKPLIWTYHPYILPTIDGLDYGSILYHCVDDLSAVPGISKTAFLNAEEKLLRRCQKVYTTARSLEKRCLAINLQTEYLPNVVDVAHFGQAMVQGTIPPDLEVIAKPRLVYHGVLSDFKVDFKLLHEAARLRPDWQWILIGEEREGQHSALLARLAALSNVHILGYRHYCELPHYLRGMNVGLLPTLINDYTRSMFPMKYYEYLAAGLPVVSTRLAFTEQVTDGLMVADDATWFVVAIEKQLVAGRLSSQDAAKYVGDNTWRARTEKMLKNLGDVKAE